MKFCDICKGVLVGSNCHQCNSSQRSRYCENCGRLSYGLRGRKGGERGLCRYCRKKEGKKNGNCECE